MSDTVTRRNEYRRFVRLVSMLLVMAVADCSTTPEPATSRPEPAAPDEAITFRVERGPVGPALRKLSSITRYGTVLLNGLEMYQVGPYTFDKTPPSIVVQQIVDDLRAEIYESPHYVFITTPRYEQLISPESFLNLDPSLAHVRVSVGFGSDTPMHSALAVLSYSTGHTLVADNAVADALCGEMHVYDTPLTASLEAVLRSARIAPGRYRIHSAPDHTFIYSAGNPARDPLLLNADSLDESQRGLLERHVSIGLPRPQDDPRHFQGQMGASTLGEVLGSLSDQIGVTVRADANMYKLPINPCVMTDVPVRTALKVLIHQWLMPEFAYEITAEGIRLRHAPNPQADSES